MTGFVVQGHICLYNECVVGQWFIGLFSPLYTPHISTVLHAQFWSLFQIQGVKDQCWNTLNLTLVHVILLSFRLSCSSTRVTALLTFPSGCCTWSGLTPDTSPATSSRTLTSSSSLLWMCFTDTAKVLQPIRRHCFSGAANQRTAVKPLRSELNVGFSYLILQHYLIAQHLECVATKLYITQFLCCD